LPPILKKGIALYELLKNIGKKLVPASWLLQNERKVRRLFAFKYAGKTYHCNVCGAGLSGFVRLGTGDLLCPFCGSLPRNRRLWQLLGEMGVSGAVLDFSPSRCLRAEMSKVPGLDYVTTDFAGEFEADKTYDITRIDEPAERFDLVICYHVLEHVEEDKQAMAELYRVLKKGGKAIIQTPFKDGDIFEDVSIRTPESRLVHFGQEDHVRIYSAQGLKSRLELAGFKVKALEYDGGNTGTTARLGMKERETILVASK